MKKLVSVVFILLLACVSNESKAKKILEQGLNDASSSVRVSAARALMKLGDGRGENLLMEMAAEEGTEQQVNALNALYDAGYTAFEPFVIRLCSDPVTAVRVAAYRIVASSNEQEARTILLQGVLDESSRVREIAYPGLGKFEETDALLQGLRDSDPIVRIAVARTLGELGTEGMADFIREELKKLRLDVWGKGVVAIAELNDTNSVDLLKRLLNEGTDELKIRAAEALLILNDHSGVQTVLRAMKSNDPFIRIHAVDVLSRYDVPEAYDDLKAAVNDEYINVAVLALEALGIYDAVNQKKLFVEVMDGSSVLLRISAAYAYLRS
ncbi:MAG: HEAT repeat domain-containing protein [candidate division WOR-3 bacterium]|nr:MAG: HEAT repeat domain-containing protein [candidate division WOR-3 bacterium]